MKKTKKIMTPIECEILDCMHVIFEMDSEMGLGAGSEVECEDGSIYAYHREDVQKVLKDRMTMKEYMDKHCIKEGSGLDKPRFEKNLEATPDMIDGEWYWELNEDFTYCEKKCFGPFVEDQHLRDLHFHSVKWIGKVRDRHITKKYSTANYPIYLRECANGEKSFYEKFEPMAADKAFRYMYIGGRAAGYINGLAELRAEYAATCSGSARLINVVICDDCIDAVRAKSLGLQPLWLNSMTAVLSNDDWKEIYRYCTDAPYLVSSEISFMEWAKSCFVKRHNLNKYLLLNESLHDCRRYINRYIARTPFLRQLERFAQWNGWELNPAGLCVAGTKRILKPLGFDKNSPQPGPPVDYIYMRNEAD